MQTCPSSLIFVDDSLPGISRKRSGKGWSYYDPEGKLIKDRAERTRLNAIALPPAYVDAWFCPASNGHILATGIDAKGRKQYRYHPEFRSAREGEKFDGCAAFGNLLPLLRKRVEDDLLARQLTRERTIAGVVRLLDLGLVRVGNEAYSQLNKSFGATTLRKRHADVSGNSLRLRYKGKSGQLQEITLTDRNLTRFVRKMQDLPGQNLFQYIDDDGDRHNVGSSEVNAYIDETMGHHFTAKNFRTWHASALAFSILAEGPEVVTIKDLLSEVASKLGNTPAVTRKSYIHPAVIDLVTGQEDWRNNLQLPRSTKYLSREERGLIAYLESSPSAEKLLAA
ncbi:DNA topoisomerase IB [Allopontixanthobacter sediminis]|uniref:DNA topoisomerase IB n=1 Tax=Allopontixanthobacter sediminis TaxID=1689985 RepID=A0A845AXD7_9SPHN|nr:DNA topoisomerase IB [Allopontixanthobacter sediminis]MXP42915.1 DNA topoisomerase IB [Allopontixanthobacter sediminis]